MEKQEEKNLESAESTGRQVKEADLDVTDKKGCEGGETLLRKCDTLSLNE